eukprot:scaffold29707_cov17-Prasinocladus_malaysianus.AAC.1
MYVATSCKSRRCQEQRTATSSDSAIIGGKMSIVHLRIFAGSGFECVYGSMSPIRQSGCFLYTSTLTDNSYRPASVARPGLSGKAQERFILNHCGFVDRILSDSMFLNEMNKIAWTS